MHKHNFIPKKLEEDGKFYYAKCDCGMVFGSPVESKLELGNLIDYLATHGRF